MMKNLYAKMFSIVMIVTGCSSDSATEFVEESESLVITSGNAETVAASSMTGFMFTSVWSYWLKMFMVIAEDVSTNGDLDDDECQFGGTVSVRYFDNQSNLDTYEFDFNDCKLFSPSVSFTGMIDGEIINNDTEAVIREHNIVHDLDITNSLTETISLYGSITLRDETTLYATSSSFEIISSGVGDFMLELNNINNACNKIKVDEKYIHDCWGDADLDFYAGGVTGFVSYETPTAFNGFDSDNQGQGQMYIDGGLESHATLTVPGTTGQLILEYNLELTEDRVTWDQMSLFDVMSLSSL